MHDHSVKAWTYDPRGNFTQVDDVEGSGGCGTCGGAATSLEEGTYVYDDMGNLYIFGKVRWRQARKDRIGSESGSR